MAIFKFFFSFSLFLFLLGVYAEDLTLEKYKNKISNETEIYRYKVGGFSTLFGALSIYQGIRVLSNNRTNSEENMAYFLFGIGGARLADGLFQLFDETQIEKSIKQTSSKENLKNDLKKAKKRYSIIRPIRSLLILTTGIGYLYLYDQDEKFHELLVYPGAIMMGISLYHYLKPYPSEKAYEEMNGKLNLSFLPLPDGGLFGLNFNF